MKIIAKNKSDLLTFLQEKVGYNSKTKVKTYLKNGFVLINNKIAKTIDDEINEGDVVSIEKIKRISRNGHEIHAPFNILFENEEFVAVNKPVGVFSSAIKDKKSRNVLSEMQKYYKTKDIEPTRLFILNRLEKELSGVLLFAKDYHIHRLLEKNWLKAHTYRWYALTEGAVSPNEGEFSDSILMNFNGKKVEKEALTEYETINKSTENSLLKIITQNTVRNQVRIHLRNNRTPILGDITFSANKTNLDRVCLHLFSINFDHPKTDEHIEIKSPLPKEFLTFIKKKLKKQKEL